MSERVIVETDDADERALTMSVLAKRGCTVTETSDGNLAVLVPDSRDAEEEVTEALNDAGVVCFVYRADAENPERSHRAGAG
jgi:hypothetical protein